MQATELIKGSDKEVPDINRRKAHILKGCENATRHKRIKPLDPLFIVLPVGGHAPSRVGRLLHQEAVPRLRLAFVSEFELGFGLVLDYRPVQQQLRQQAGVFSETGFPCRDSVLRN